MSRGVNPVQASRNGGRIIIDTEWACKTIASRGESMMSVEVKLDACHSVYKNWIRDPNHKGDREFAGSPRLQNDDRCHHLPEHSRVLLIEQLGL